MLADQARITFDPRFGRMFGQGRQHAARLMPGRDAFLRFVELV